jgi:hypothetical protein
MNVTIFLIENLIIDRFLDMVVMRSFNRSHFSLSNARRTICCKTRVFDFISEPSRDCFSNGVNSSIAPATSPDLKRVYYRILQERNFWSYWEDIMLAQWEGVTIPNFVVTSQKLGTYFVFGTRKLVVFH